MRVLLDAHVSSRHVGRALVRRGHDVKALDTDEALSSLPDADVLALARREERVLVTRNIRHFAPLLRQYAEGGERHTGCILVALPHSEFGAILRGLDRLFEERPEKENWESLAMLLGT